MQGENSNGRPKKTNWQVREDQRPKKQTRLVLYSPGKIKHKRTGLEAGHVNRHQAGA